MYNVYSLAIKWVCNTNCTFCNFFEIKWKINEEEHLEELKKEVEGLHNKWINIINIWINWYESTVFTYFFEILDFIKSKNLYIHLTTNWVKLANENFTKKLSKFIDSVTITLYSSNDKEHHILTQNKDSYYLKHKAVLNSLKYGIKVDLNILLLTPTILNLDVIINQISKYFTNKNLSKNIKLIFPNSVMWKDRNKLLIPSFTSTLEYIKLVLHKFSNIFLENNITLEINDSIPKCLFNFNYNDKIFLYGKNKINTNNEKLNKFSNRKRIFFSKCNNCKNLNDCSWVELDYINNYWDSEIEKWNFLENTLSLDSINNSLIDLLNKYKNEWERTNFKNINACVKEYKKIVTLPKKMLNFYIKDVYIMNNSIKKIRFMNEFNDDSFDINLNLNHLGNYIISITDPDKNTHQRLIAVFIHKALNRI